MADCQVTCVNKQPRANPHEGITHLGGEGWTPPWRLREAALRASSGFRGIAGLVRGRSTPLC